MLQHFDAIPVFPIKCEAHCSMKFCETDAKMALTSRSKQMLKLSRVLWTAHYY